MKKILFAIVLVSGIICASSCSKECSCKAIVNGETVYETSITKEDGKKCSDYATSINVPGLVNTSVDCKAKL